MNKKVKKELLKRWQERVAWIQSQDFAVAIAETPDIRNARMAMARQDYAFFVATYFPHLAPKPCGKFQLDAAYYLKEHPKARAVFEWARGHAKSSHISLMIPLWLKIQEPKEINVMLLVSKSETIAIRLLSDLQAELQYNELYLRDFGKQVSHGSWSEGEFKTNDGCYFMAIGRGQSPRGAKNRSKRPDYISIDDIDDDEIVRSPKRVSDAYEWCKTALFGTTDMGRGRYVLVGNRIAKDSILSRMAISKGTYHTIVNALVPDGDKWRPSWHENHTLKEVDELRDFIGERFFQKEYMNNPVSEGAVFSLDDIRFGKMLDLKLYRTLICYTDTSYKDTATADYKATLLIGKAPNGEFHILKVFCEKTSVSNMIRWHYAIRDYVAGRCPVLYWMEANFLQDLHVEEFKNYGNACGDHIPIRGDKRKKPDKYARIEALQPLFEKKLVVINEEEKDSPGVKHFLDQAVMFEKGSRFNEDTLDAFEGGVWMIINRDRSREHIHILGKREGRKW